jgi:carboxypeptidase Q
VSYSILKELGATALLLPGGDPNNAPGEWVDTDNGAARVLPLPVAELGMEDSKLIFDLSEGQPVSIGFQYVNQVTGPEQVNNVIAEIRGRENPDQWVLVGAHLDSWDLGMGCQDNGTGSVMVLEAARAIASLPASPRRSIRFALWTGEEPGLLGSKAYAKAHSGELDHFVAVINTDAGAGRPLGWKVDGRTDLRDSVKSLVSGHLQDLGADGVSMKINVDTDHSAFMLQGIPPLDLWVDTAHYDEVAHKSGDTFDKVDPINFKADAAVLAVTAYIVAELPQPIAKHIDHGAVGEIIKNAGLDGYLTAHGDWQP